MENCQKTVSEVRQFLENVKRLLFQKGKVIVNNRPWANGKVNKTLAYMAETGIKQEDMECVINELQVCHYSYTDWDSNSKFPNEQFWFFGITKKLVDQEEALYIKLKIREIRGQSLLIMSFHPEQPSSPELKLGFPYQDYQSNIEGP
ncbi:MAG: type II toxin-antitoxin system MqsR family toxin [Lachnospiraceae bacterium]|jgi:hypothetical protein|nr:type II toxin-antitoxin system MqsR family toxin [Lachnospiraceae bacterium]MCI9530513.1 type II toxin-antitoxin system MqsR family toxin [Lachnospiraceae bacterium]